MDVKTPKNRIQIGQAEKGDKIYIEDYVVTYLKQSISRDSHGGLAGLFGTCREVDGVREFYIYAAAYAEGREGEGRIPRESVQKIMRMRAESFEDHFFLGWCVVLGTESGAVWEEFYRSRMDSLLGLPELLLTVGQADGEMHFYTYPTEMPSMQEGYFIFYEQNDRMQNFMVDDRWKSGEERKREPDEVARTCREFYTEQKAKKQRGRMAAAGCVCLLALMALALGSRVADLFRNSPAKDATQEVALLEDADVMTNDGEVPVWDEDIAISEDAGGVSLAQEDAGVTPLSQGDAGQALFMQEDAGAIPLSQEDAGEISPAQEGTGEIPLSQGETGLSQKGTGLPSEDGDTENADNEPESEAAGSESADKEKQKKEKTVAAMGESAAVYVVQKGDTLCGICMSFYGNLSLLEDVCELNELEDPNNILCGQKILLPKQNL